MTKIWLALLFLSSHLLAVGAGMRLALHEDEIVRESFAACVEERSECAEERRRYADEWSACVDELRSRK